MMRVPDKPVSVEERRRCNVMIPHTLQHLTGDLTNQQLLEHRRLGLVIHFEHSAMMMLGIIAQDC